MEKPGYIDEAIYFLKIYLKTGRDQSRRAVYNCLRKAGFSDTVLGKNGAEITPEFATEMLDYLRDRRPL